MSGASNSFSDRLEEARLAKGVSASELARIASVTPSYISLLRAGKAKNPSIDALHRIANALNVTVEWLNGGDSDSRVQESRPASSVNGIAVELARDLIKVMRKDDIRQLLRRYGDDLEKADRQSSKKADLLLELAFESKAL